MADAAEKNFDLYVVFSRIASRELWWRQAAMSHWRRNTLLPCTWMYPPMEKTYQHAEKELRQELISGAGPYTDPSPTRLAQSIDA